MVVSLLIFIVKRIMSLLLWTCRIEMQGLERFCRLAKEEKCLLMFWHNRLSILPFILSKYAKNTLFACVVSSHGDGQMLSRIIHSFPNGRTIVCSKKEGYLAIREMIRHLNEERLVIIITPDGPRGPLHEVKPGVAAAALRTGASVIPLHWEANRYFELKTWDRQRIPKPFSTVRIVFGSPIRFPKDPAPSLEEAQRELKSALFDLNSSVKV